MNTSNLYESALALFTPAVATRASHLLNEDAEAVRYGLSGIVPLIAEGVAEKSGDSAISDLASEYSQDAAYSDPEALMSSPDYNDWLGDNSSLLGTVFGDKAVTVLEAVAAKANLRLESVRALAMTAIPAVLGLMGRANRREREKREDGGDGKMPSWYVNE